MTRHRSLRAYRKSIRRNLGDSFLVEALDRFVTSYRDSRLRALSSLDFERARRAIVMHKGAVIDDMDRYVGAFAAEAEKRGARVHRAANGEEAAAIITRIARDHEVRRVVKSKSMTAEEIQLNPVLESAGIEVTETDLGEWIIQLRGENPSHMVLPAIHLSRRDVAALFSKLTDRCLDPDDIGALVDMARTTLRTRFLDADMGITGANFALASSGTIGLVTNEGNARLVTSLPPVHVVLLGIDKVVRDVRAALDILAVLPRSATGQAMTTYVTWLTGTTPCETAADGIRKTHIVLLDNGRSEIAHTPFSSVLRCIRCGACANVCPVFRTVGGHLFGHIYVGPIGVILTYFYHGAQHARLIAKNCINCLACKTVCPAGIDLPRLIKAISAAATPRRAIRHRAVGSLVGHRSRLHRMFGLAAWLQGPFKREPGLIRLPKMIPKPHRFRDLPPLAQHPFRSRFRAPALGGSAANRSAVLFGGCLMDFVYPEQGHAFVKLLDRSGTQLAYPRGQGCCGLPAFLMGETKAARRAAAANVDALFQAPFDHCVVLCASCGSFLKDHVAELLADDAQRAERAADLAARVIDFSSFIHDVIGLEHFRFEMTGTPTAYHNPCHLCRGFGVTHAPRTLIGASGNTYLATPDEQVCCGFGGSYSLDFPEISAQLVTRKLAQVERAGARILVTDCPGCILQLRGAESKRGGSLEILHMAELLERSLIRDPAPEAGQ